MSKPGITRDMKVVNKGLKGKHNTPYIVLKNDEGEKTEIHFKEKAQLKPYRLGQVLTVQLVGLQKEL